MRILFFGKTVDIAGRESADWSELEVDRPPPVDTSELRAFLINRYPELGAISSLGIAVNGKLADDQQGTRIGDEIALIPPVSGG